MFRYSKDTYFIGKQTIYVFFEGKKIGWIAARKDYEWGKIYFCYNPTPKQSKKIGTLYNTNNKTLIFDKIEELEDWVIDYHQSR